MEPSNTESNPTHTFSFGNPDGSEVPQDQRSDITNTYFLSVLTCENDFDSPLSPTQVFLKMPPIRITALGIAKVIEKQKKHLVLRDQMTSQIKYLKVR